MNNARLSFQFYQSINWNAFAYVCYKIASTALLFLLYKDLSVDYFSLWANINSITFLLLLWIGCGFNKSIPRFIPELLSDKKEHTWFIRVVILARIIITVCTLPVFYFFINTLFKKLSSIEHQETLYLLSGGIFFFESIVAIFKYILHAHFWNKEYNSIYTSIIAVEVFANYICIRHTDSNAHLMLSIFITKLVSAILVVLASGYLIARLYHSDFGERPRTIAPINRELLLKQFTIHSLFMWASNIVKSLSERNFLVPLFTYTFGPAQANIYKVANETALLFYRSALKTVGSSDTVILTHMYIDKGSAPQLFFTQLTKTIIALSAIVLTIGVCATYLNIIPLDTITAWHIFIIVITSCLMEMLLSPYERLLEVSYSYKKLFLAYVPYLITVMAVMSSSIIYSLGITPTLCMLHGARLAGSCLMAFWARKEYTLHFPWRYACYATLAVIIFLCSLIYLI